MNFIYTDLHGDTKVRLKNAVDNKYAFKFYAIEKLEAILEKCQGTHEDDELLVCQQLSPSLSLSVHIQFYYLLT